MKRTACSRVSARAIAGAESGPHRASFGRSGISRVSFFGGQYSTRLPRILRGQPSAKARRWTARRWLFVAFAMEAARKNVCGTEFTYYRRLRLSSSSTIFLPEQNARAASADTGHLGAPRPAGRPRHDPFDVFVISLGPFLCFDGCLTAKLCSTRPTSMLDRDESIIWSFCIDGFCLTAKP